MLPRSLLAWAYACTIAAVGLVSLPVAASDDALQTMKQRRLLSSGWNSSMSEMKMTRRRLSPQTY